MGVKFRVFFAIGICAAVLLPAANSAAPQQAQSASDLVAQLGDADPAVREAAMRALWELGESAVSALESSAESRDPEVAGRARLLLGRIQLGIGPEAPASLVRLVMQARHGADPDERAQARQLLAATPTGAAPAIARLIRDALADPEPRDPIAQVLRQLWPADHWALSRIADELSRMDGGQVVLDWLEHAAAIGIVPAAPSFAYAVRQRGDLATAIQRWRGRVDAEPSPEHRRVLACLLFAAGDAEAPQFLPADAAAAIVPVAWALLEGDEDLAAERAAAHPDELTRMTLELLLARAADDWGRDMAAVARVRTWLNEHAPELEAAVREGGALEAAPRPSLAAQARRAVIAAMLIGDMETAASLANEVDAPGLVRLHYRRLDFDAGAQVVARHTQRQGAQTRNVQVTQRRMRQELEMQPQRGQPANALSSFAKRRIAALEAMEQGDAATAAALFEQLVMLDDADPAPRWAWGAALASAGNEAEGSAQVERAVFMPLANPWVRRGLAEEMWLCGQREEALEQLRQSVLWGMFIPVDALPAIEGYADSLTQADQQREAARAQAAAMVLLLIDEVYEQLADRALYFACYLASELERTRMNRAADAADWPRAEAALGRTLGFLPQSEAPVDLVTKLEAAGHKPTADRIFIAAFTPLSAALGRYAQSSMLNNQAAWLAASCDRRLDTALNLAQAAVACDPTSPAALDTLAEVHLRRGQPQKALELLDRVLALAEARDALSSVPYGQVNGYLARRAQFMERIKVAGATGSSP